MKAYRNSHWQGPCRNRDGNGGSAYAFDYLRDPVGAVAVGHGDFVYALWIHSPSPGNRRRGTDNSTPSGA